MDSKHPPLPFRCRADGRKSWGLVDFRGSGRLENLRGTSWTQADFSSQICLRRHRYWIGESNATAGQDEIWNSLQEAGMRQSEQCRLDLEPLTYPRRWECLDRLTTAFILRALTQLGAFRTAGECRTLDSLLQTCGISRAFRRLVLRWLERLASEGYLRKFRRVTSVAIRSPFRISTA